MTKSIPSKGYLLVERTTASSPDPVPGINDESGSFGGSGFANTGESLVLKDADDALIQSLDFSSGWPAGDSATKETMQWNGTTWVTATPTPKAPFSGGSSDDDDVPPAPVVSAGATAWSAPKSTPHIELVIPKTVYATVLSEYSATTVLEYDKAYNGVFLWNMGDGTTYKNTVPTTVSHRYQYPGTYTASFAYYRTLYDTKPVLFESVEIVAHTPTVSLTIVPGKGFQFTNTDSVRVDISGWVIALSDRVISLPPFTIIPPKKTVLMPFSAFGISGTYTTATLETPERIVVGVDKGEVVSQKTPLVSYSSSSAPRISVYDTASNSLAIASAADAFSTEEASSTTKNPRSRMWIFGAVLVVVIGLFIFLEKIIASQREE
jgi:hypothetical protein